MSRENVALFVKAINTKCELNEKVAQAPRATDWVAIASDAGFDFTVDELVAVFAETLKQPLTEANVIREYVAASRTAIKRELPQRVLAAVVGGMKPAYVRGNPLFVRASF